MAPEKKNSAVKKSSKKITEKYASKLIGEVIDALTEKVMKDVKTNPKSTTKWLGKMKLSIQKKVSQATLEIFISNEGRQSTSKESPEVLELEIEKTKKAIASKANNIKDISIKALKQSGNKYKPSSLPSDELQQQHNGKFETHLVSIEQKFKEIAQNVDSAATDIVGRIAALKTTMNTVQHDFAKLKSSSSKPKIISAISNKSGNSGNSGSGSGSGSGGSVSSGGVTPAAVRVGRILQ